MSAIMQQKVYKGRIKELRSLILPAWNKVLDQRVIDTVVTQ